MIRDRDRGARALLQRVKKKPTVRVGVLGEGGEPKLVRREGRVSATEDTVADIARKHEFGIGVPRRSFIADWVDESQADARRRLRRAAERIRDEGGVELELERFGLWAQGEIQMRISRGIDPPLSQARIDEKGSETPLIDTGQLRSSITYEVDNG